MKILQIMQFYDNNTWSDSNHLQLKAKRADSVLKHDLCFSLKLDNISYSRTLVIFDNFVHSLVTNLLFLDTIQLYNQKDRFKET